MALTSLPAVKAWLNVTSTNDDVLLTRLISQISGAILNAIQRPSIVRTAFTESRGGVGNQRLMLRNWPVAQVSALTIDGASIPASTNFTQNGYVLTAWDGTAAGNPQELTLRGYCFSRGLNNISISYDAGYCISGQAATIPGASYQLAISTSLGSWAQNDGVTYADGTALTPVSSNPAQGQYSITADGFGSATYTFNSADSTKSILISYSYTPYALEQACIEWVGERYRYKDRIGQSSMSLGGNETAAYSLKGVPDFVDALIAPFTKSIPL